MLNKLINSDDFFDDLGRVVEATPGFKSQEDNFLKALKKLSKDAQNEIDGPVIGMVAAAIREACRIGIASGVSFITECLSNRGTTKSIDYNQAMTREDYRKAWDLKAEAYNRLMDLLTDHEVDVDTAMKAVEEYGDSAGAYALASAKLSIPEAI